MLSPFPMFAIILALVALSAVLLIVGLVLRRRGKLRTRAAALAWAVLTVAPLFGSAAALRATHIAERAQGETPDNVNIPPR